jgi:hypothetical protein
MQLAARLHRFIPPALLLAVLSCAHAAALAEVAVPAELRGWEEWALRGNESHRCPWLVPGMPTDDARVCAWPSVLELQVDEHGGRFSQRWQVSSDSWVPLPGNSENWPEDVTVDGSPAAVVSHLASPAIRAASGVHTVAGSFHWTRRPEALAVPENVGLVNLSMSGTRLANPQRSEAGITLGAGAAARQDDHVDVHVFRRLDDALPARLTTEVHLAIAGEAREIRLPSALPAGFQPTAIESVLAARLDPDNTLRVQVRPGEFDVIVAARGPSPVSEVSIGQRAQPWPDEEVWSFSTDDRLRVAAIEGVAAVDPAQADVPQGWRHLPAYRMDHAATLRVIERSRGLSAANGDELQLQRTVWLDFTGKGWTIVDRLTGAMRQGWRLDLETPYSLRSARAASNEPLLVTEGQKAGLNGVELRSSQLDLTAVSRLERAGGSLPATGWRTRFRGVSGTLVMAPGYRLLAAFGPDSAPQAWLERWGLLDIFIVLLTATVAWRMLGVRAAAIALAATALIHQELGAPTWLWLVALVSLGLQRAAPEGRLRDWASGGRILALALLLLTLVPFAIRQVRLAVYPQLEAIPTLYQDLVAVYQDRGVAGAVPESPAPNHTYTAYNGKPGRMTDEARLRLEAKTLGAAAPISGMMASAPVQEVVATAARSEPRKEIARYEPGAVIQAGPGVPDWSYHSYPFSWSGAVEQNATARFVISPPWMTRLWRLLGLLFAALLVVELTRRDLPSTPGWWRERPQAPAAVLLLGIALCGTTVPVGAATTPDPALIDQLRTQLLEAPKCVPDCAAVLSADVTAGAGRLSVALNVSALDPVGVALPRGDPAWTPDLVQVDGAGPAWVQRSPQGIRYVNLARGRHVVRIEGSIEHLAALTLAFPSPPHVVDVHAPDWEVGGLTDRHLMSGALELARKRVAGAAPSPAMAQEEFRPFVAVDRMFHLGRDWRVDTTLTRVAPKSGAFTVSLPLLADEAVTTPGLRASDGRVSLGLGAGEPTQSFSSILPRSDTLELVARREDTHSERWSFEVAPTWHAEFSGIPAVAPREDSGRWIFEYYPRPGERLQVKVTRPPASAGGTLAFDNITLQTVAGTRSSDTSLQLRYRSTQGGRQTLHIPAEAIVTQVLSDGQPIALRPEHGELSLSALPGTHTWSVDWRSPTGVRLLTRSPPVSQAAPACNLRLAIRLPEDRWVLYAFGPGVGPAILYWGELLVFIVAAWWIGRTALAPLPTRDWLLLGLGLSTFSWLALALFALFVAFFQWRVRRPAPAKPQRFKLLQVFSAAVAIIAILAVVSAVPGGLLAYPDMHIAPSEGGDGLSWFIDQSSESLPTPSVLSISLWWYKVAMLAWALWLSFALTRWTRWAWQVFARDGVWPRRPQPPARAAEPAKV